MTKRNLCTSLLNSSFHLLFLLQPFTGNSSKEYIWTVIYFRFMKVVRLHEGYRRFCYICLLHHLLVTLDSTLIITLLYVFNKICFMAQYQSNTELICNWYIQFFYDSCLSCMLLFDLLSAFHITPVNINCFLALI